MLDELTTLAKQKYVAPYFLAGIHVGLGENDRAIEYLEKSYDEHSHWLIYLHMDPSMDGLRDDPRFQDLLRRVGLPISENRYSQTRLRDYEAMCESKDKISGAGKKVEFLYDAGPLECHA